MTEFSKALVERVARIITQTVHRNGSVTAFWNSEEEVKETARAVLTAAGLDEAIEALEPFARIADSINPGVADNWILEGAWTEGVFNDVRARDFRRARTLTDKLKG